MDQVLQECKSSVEHIYSFRRSNFIQELVNGRLILNDNQICDELEICSSPQIHKTWERLHNRIRMELNVLDTSVLPVLQRIDTIIHIESLIQNEQLSLQIVASGIQAFESKNYDVDNRVVFLLRDSDMCSDTPGYKEWKESISRRYADSSGSVVVDINSVDIGVGDEGEVNGDKSNSTKPGPLKGMSREIDYCNMV